ncbi:MAG: 4-(cytidine 5'-diphospho)-2-C-methyl-D-erythritol kinase [Clostridia bacterium]|nr:4-(cytidine 5'-diphospho)-2-C-methyl-D-erythritol kinase [Clostridia bacterium]
MEITIKARAKINLTLDVVGRLPDGYHEVEMVMQALELHDTLTLRSQEEGIAIACDHPQVPTGEGNLVYRCARALQQATGIDRGVHITIDKRLPVAAGLAGGSSNGAAALIGLNKLWNLGLTREQLMEIGVTLGADIPFCILGGTALAKGKGEKLTPLQGIKGLPVVLVNPPMGVSTAEVYKNFDGAKVSHRPNIRAMIDALASGDCRGVVDNLGNVLETVTLEMHPEIAIIKVELLAAGALGVLMSGSGPTVFAITTSQEEGAKIAQRLTHRGAVFVTSTS